MVFITVTHKELRIGQTSLGYAFVRLVCRDIKLENCLVNLLYHQGMPYNIVKICDFGYCKNVEKDSLPDSLVGTAAYLSLDILKHPKGTGYDAKLVDIWSCGVLLYYLLEGRFPFGTGQQTLSP